MMRTILGCLIAVTLLVATAIPAAAHESYYRSDRHGYRSSRYYHRDWRRDGNWRRHRSHHRDWRRYRTDKDADHARHHRILRRDHRKAHRKGFRSREDHKRWHKKANEHHDADHHRIYDRHARRDPFTRRRRW